MRTQRELQAEMEKMKESLIDFSLKLELVRKQNNDLKDDAEKDKKRIKELEPFEEVNIELRETNHGLTDKVRDLMEEIEDMTGEVEDLRDQNAKFVQIQEESVKHMEQQNAALEEAAEIIVRVEDEKNTLVQENAQLKEQIARLQRTHTAETYNTGFDGSAKDRRPSRVYSIDESRPSTSHFDSDYYSQPASPHVKASKESLPSIALSERAQNFLTMNQDGAKSVQDLKKRLSDASMKMAIKRKESIPDVPQIPSPYQHAKEPAQPTKPLTRTPRRRQPKHSLSPALAMDPYAAVNSSTTPTTPTSDGLRGMFRDGLSLDTSTRNSRPSSSYAKSPLDSKTSKASRESDRIAPPARGSSRHAPTSSSSEHLKTEPSTDAQTEVSETSELPPPPSLISEDMTSELDAVRRDRWWKNVDRLHSNNVEPHSARQRSFLQSAAVEALRPDAGVRGTGQQPYLQKDFIFNGAEDEEMFLRKAQGYMPRRR